MYVCVCVCVCVFMLSVCNSACIVYLYVCIRVGTNPYRLALSTSLLNYLLLVWWGNLDWTSCGTLLNVYHIFIIHVSISFLRCAFSSTRWVSIWWVFFWTVDLSIVLIINKLFWNNLGRTENRERNWLFFF